MAKPALGTYMALPCTLVTELCPCCCYYYYKSSSVIVRSFLARTGLRFATRSGGEGSPNGRRLEARCSAFGPSCRFGGCLASSADFLDVKWAALVQTPCNDSTAALHLVVAGGRYGEWLTSCDEVEARGMSGPAFTCWRHRK